MSRRLATAVELAAALLATVYILIAMAQKPDHPAVRPGELTIGTLLAFAAFLVALALYVAAKLGGPRMLRRWRRRAVRRAVRRMARDRARRMQRRHAARIGAAR